MSFDIKKIIINKETIDLKKDAGISNGVYIVRVRTLLSKKEDLK